VISLFEMSMEMFRSGWTVGTARDLETEITATEIFSVKEANIIQDK
jgi:hypothetical protein